MPQTVRHQFGGVTYKVKPFCGCVGLYAICNDQFGEYVSTTPDYIFNNVADMLADNFMEVA